MDNELELILSKGFLPPNELPKIFSTDSFAAFYVKNRHSIPHVKKASKCIRLSCPKVGLSRKQMKIPNPLHYGYLASYLTDNWETFEPIFKDSTISSSKPKLTEKAISRPLYSFKYFSRNCIRDSYKYMYELNTDISKFYPSVYTHSIAWAVDGKDKAKDSSLRKGLIGNELDYRVRLLQDNQSVGIPIGPYCSQIISELISCRIDKRLQKSVKYLIGHRFIDDRKLYFDNYNDAEECYNALLSHLSYFELDPNTSKTSIKKLPIPINPSWIIEIQNFNFREVKTEPSTSFEFRKKTIQETDLVNFFSIVFNLALEFPNDYVFKYSIKIIKNLEIVDGNIDLFESLIYKSLLTESSIIPDIVDLLVKYKSKIDLSKLSILISQFIALHSNKSHDYELIWALYLAKLFEVKVKSDLIDWIDKYSNSFVKYLVYDLYKSSLIEGFYGIDKLYKGLSTTDLLDEDWIFTYFAYCNELPECDFSQINDPEYQIFKKLRKEKIDFYGLSFIVEKEISVEKSETSSDIIEDKKELAKDDDKIDSEKDETDSSEDKKIAYVIY